MGPTVNFIFRFLLFVSSYFPAFAIVCILYWPKNRLVSFIAIGTGLLGLIALALSMLFLSSLQSLPIIPNRWRRQDTETMTYVVSYVIPFLVGGLKGTESAIAFGIFFVVIGILYANSNMVHINPMLNLVGFHLYQVEPKDSQSIILISRRGILPGYAINAVSAGNDIYLEVRDGKKDKEGGRRRKRDRSRDP